MKPKTRIENFLAKIAGSSEAKEMEPKTRVEYFLNDIAQSGGGSGGGGGVFVVKLVSDNDGGYTADKTLDEIYAAEDEGRPIIGVYDDDGDVSTLLFHADTFFGMVNWSENSCDATVFKANYDDPSKKYYTATRIIWSVTIN